jgi:phosphohistidine phosphatase
MDVYILRHGPAEERGPEWPDDDARPLSAEGKAKTRGVASGIKALGVAPDAIYSSPLVRARQTAEIVAKTLSLTSRLHETGHLAPGGDPDALFAAIREATPGADAVMLVGHEPDLGCLASRLLTGNAHGVDAPLKKAGLVRIEIDEPSAQGGGTLRWFLAPGHLRAIGKDPAQG